MIFIDEIDSLLGMRREDDLEGTRRLKTEFLVQLDGVASASDVSILVIGATNRPQDLDEAARRRFVKRLYIPLPDAETRRALFEILLKKNENEIDAKQLEALVQRADGYSGADIHNLCREAAMGPIRDVSKRSGLAQMDVGLHVCVSVLRRSYPICAPSAWKISITRSDRSGPVWARRTSTATSSGTRSSEAWEAPEWRKRVCWKQS